MNLTALDSRLNSTCLTLRSSASMTRVVERDVEFELDALARGPLADHRHPALDRLPQGERIDLQLHSAGLDLGQVEDVVDQREQVPARAADVVDVLELLLVELAEDPLGRTSEKPMIAFSGVRSSCDMLARNSDLWRLAVSSSRYSRPSSSLVRFMFDASEPSSSRLGTTTSPLNLPAAIAPSRPSIDRIGPMIDHDSTYPLPSARITLMAAIATKRRWESANELRFSAITAFVWSIVPCTRPEEQRFELR